MQCVDSSSVLLGIIRGEWVEFESQSWQLAFLQMGNEGTASKPCTAYIIVQWIYTNSEDSADNDV